MCDKNYTIPPGTLLPDNYVKGWLQYFSNLEFSQFKLYDFPDIKSLKSTNFVFYIIARGRNKIIVTHFDRTLKPKIISLLEPCIACVGGHLCASILS